MEMNVYTINIDDEIAVALAKILSDSRTQISEFGVEEINNTSAIKRMKNRTEKGFEKNVVSSTQKSVKQKVNEVEDYFDFCFKKGDNMAVTKKETIKIAKEVVADTDAYLVMNLARMGSLFGCDKRAINA